MSDDRTFWLGLGANLGEPRESMVRMLAGLAEASVRVEAVSSLYDTAPRELVDQPAFMNAAARVSSDLAPPDLLARVKEIEASLGRVAGVRFGPRVIDCDLLLWGGGAWSGPGLEIPHPRLTERRFALVPLLEIDPQLVLPDGRSLADCERRLPVAEQRVERRVPGSDWAALN